MAHGCTHTTYLAISTFVNNNAKQAVANSTYLSRTSQSVFEFDTFAKSSNRRRRWITFYACEVFLCDAGTWMRQQMCKSSIVSKD